MLSRLKLKYPLIVAPMAGGPSTVDLVVASSESGALGSIGAAYANPAEIKSLVAQVRAKTAKAFAINLFCPHSEISVASGDIEVATEATKAYRQELGLKNPELNPPFAEDFEAQFNTILALKPTVLSFVFGLLNSDQVKEAKRLGIYLIGTATTLEEAGILEASGVDAITLQGIEAGGHRGIFDPQAMDSEVKTFDLLKQCLARVRIPLIPAGGIMHAGQIQMALSMGATAVQMGTAFLACAEAGTSTPYRRALLANPRVTKTTRVFSGRLARGIENRFMTEMERLDPSAILPFPAQNEFTRDLRNASAKNESAEFLSLWAGTGQGILWEGSCRDLIHSLFP